MKWWIILLGAICAIPAEAQLDWTWTERAPLPEATANNAVCAAVVLGDERVYSFGGIGTGLHRTAIHRRAYRYSTTEDAWTILPELPDSSGKIASAASVVNGIAYVIGGYHVLAGSPFELSSDRVHRFDLATETWLPDGAPIPIPIDDHVQAVWRDSLIYVVTGWSNNTNVAAVQIYDPALDAWSVGTPVPNNNLYKVFGASGTIIGDTIHYYGGASLGGSFPAQDELRMGVIDPGSPTTITWAPAISTGRARYRTGCGVYGNRPFWVGGSAVSYNYDAVAYNGTGVVAPAGDIAVLPTNSGPFAVAATPAEVMDLRGLGELGSGGFHICGGIGVNATVLATNWLVQPGVGMDVQGNARPVLYPNPSEGRLTIELPREFHAVRYEILDSRSAVLRTGVVRGDRLQVDLVGSANGTYIVKLIGRDRVTMVRFWLVN